MVNHVLGNSPSGLGYSVFGNSPSALAAIQFSELVKATKFVACICSQNANFH